MGWHLEGVKRILDPEAFEDFVRRTKDIIDVREDLVTKFKYVMAC